MRKSRLCQAKQDRFIEHFVSGSTARTAAAPVGVNRNTAAYYFQRLRQLISQAQGLPGTALANGHEPGGNKFRGVHPAIDWETTLTHAVKIGLGNRDYELVRLEPKGKSWQPRPLLRK